MDRGRSEREGSSDQLDQTLSRVGSSLGRQPAVPPSSRRSYLLILEEDSSHVFELPLNGSFVIGRAKDADLELKDPSVSRAHARIVITDGEAEISDLGSHNGTHVQDDRVVGTRTIVPGDVIRICDTLLVYRSSHRPQPTYTIVEYTRFRRCAEGELQRSIRHQSPLTLVAISLGDGKSDPPAALAALESRLRASDVVTWAAVDQLLFLLPDTGMDEGPQVCQRLLQLLSPIAPRAQGGCTTFPADGSDLDALLAGVREAMRAARPGTCASAAQSFQSVRLGVRELIIADPAMARLYDLVKRLAVSGLSVLICGETGTGKELAATALHLWSRRHAQPLKVLNCAAIPENLVESELFGHEKGAFTGAESVKQGLLEAASGGTVFLDEVGELPAAAQAKLLRVLEEKRVTRLGALTGREVDIRLVAATNRELEREVEAGRFRRDLYFRICAGKIWLPPLRDRPRELPILAQTFLLAACSQARRPPLSISDAGMRVLAAHEWPGNIRELRNLMEYFAATAREAWIDEAELASRLGVAPDMPEGRLSAPPRPGKGLTTSGGDPAGQPQAQFRKIDEELRDLERQRMHEALAASGGNKTRAAELIGMPLRTFMRKFELYGMGRSVG